METDLDTLYSPSKYCKRFDREGSLRYFNQFVNKGSEHVRKILQCHLNIPYGSDIHQRLDVYGVDLKDDSPIFVFLHGGYWQEFSKDNSCFMAEMFYNAGIRTIVIGFNLCPVTTLSGQVNEAIAGIKKSLELAEKWGSKKVVIMGYSSGAHLLASFLPEIPKLSATHKSVLKGLVMVSGIYDLLPLCSTYVNEVLNLTEEQAKVLSPYNKKTEPVGVKIFVLVAEYESPAFIEQSKNYTKKLKENGDLVEYFLYEKQDHFTVVEHLTEDSHELSKLVLNLLK